MDNERQIDCSIDAYRSTYKELDHIWITFSKACGLSEAEYWALLMYREGCSTQTEISEALSMNKQTVHSALKQLVKKGIVHLETKEDNLRVKEIFLTKEGEAFVEKYIDSILKIEEHVWGLLEAEERERLIQISRKYNRLLDEALIQYLQSPQ